MWKPLFTDPIIQWSIGIWRFPFKEKDFRLSGVRVAKEELKIARTIFQASIYPVMPKEPEEEEGMVTMKEGEAALSGIDVTLP